MRLGEATAATAELVELLDEARTLLDLGRLGSVDPRSNRRPTCWRLSFCFVQDRRPPFRHPDEHLDYLDEAAARRHYNRLKEEFGASVVASVTPVWPKPPDISSKRAKLAALVAAGMPEQLSPRAAEKRARRDAQRQRKPGKP